MGKGDKRSRRGKIFAGSFGKTRKKHKKAAFAASAVKANLAAAEEKAPKKRMPKRLPAAALVVEEAPAVEEAPSLEEKPAVEEEVATAE